MKHVIGVLGGIGPQASVDFYNELLRQAHLQCKIDHNEDYPHIIINSIPAPELYLDKPNLQMYIEGVQTLEKSGASIISIACNTAYTHFELLQSNVSIPIINLPELVKKGLPNETFLIGTAKLEQTKLFEKEGTHINYLNKKQQILFHKAITEILQNNKDALSHIRSLAPEDKTIIVACSEASIAFKDRKNTIDTMKLLAKETITRWKHDNIQ